MKKVSIIIPTYNRPKTILRCIDSIKKQTYKNWEIIIIDDCSTENYKIEKGKRIRYIRRRRSKGPASARNLGIRMANGEIIFTLDDDIILKPNYLQILVSDLENKKNENVVAVGGRLFYPNKPNLGIEKGPLYEISKFTGDITLRASVDTKSAVYVPTMHSCTVYYKKLFKIIGYFDEKSYKGNFTYVEPDFFFRVRKAGYKILFEPKAVAYHLQIREGGCRNMSRLKYNWYTIRNAFFFIKKFHGWHAIYMWPLFILSRLVKQ